MPAVTFDVWHTLVYLTPAEEEAYYRAQVAWAVETLREADPDPGVADVPDADLARAYEHALEEAVTAAGEGRTVTPLEQIARAAHACHRRVEPDRYRDGLASLVERMPFKAAPGAADLLAALRQDGYRIAIVGNTVGETGRSLRRVLGRLGMGVTVEAFVFSDEQPWAKPSPEIFWSALELLAVAPERAVHVGDAWTDIEGARRARLRGSVLYTGLQSYGAHYRALNIGDRLDRTTATAVTADLSEVPGIVHRLLPLP